MKFQIKKATNNQYYWVLKAGNGEEIAKSSEYYVAKHSAGHSIDIVMKNAAYATIEDLT